MAFTLGALTVPVKWPPFGAGVATVVGAMFGATVVVRTGRLIGARIVASIGTLFAALPVASIRTLLIAMTGTLFIATIGASISTLLIAPIVTSIGTLFIAITGTLIGALLMAAISQSVTPLPGISIGALAVAALVIARRAPFITWLLILLLSRRLDVVGFRACVQLAARYFPGARSGALAWGTGIALTDAGFQREGLAIGRVGHGGVVQKDEGLSRMPGLGPGRPASVEQLKTG